MHNKSSNLQNSPICRFSYNCANCHTHIGDDFDNETILVRKDLVKEVLATKEEETTEEPSDSVQKDIITLKNSVEQLRNDQDEIKRAIMILKDSFENQIIDVKRSILHLANELNKLQ